MIPGLDPQAMKLINKWKWITILSPIILYLLIFTLLLGVVIGMAKSFTQDACGGWQGFITGIMLVDDEDAAYRELCRLGGRLGEGGEGGASGCYVKESWSCKESVEGGLPNIPADHIPWIKDAAKKNYISEIDLIALIHMESAGWQVKASASGSSASGLGQFITSTANKYKEFTGGKDEFGIVWPAGKIYSKEPFPDDDARFDPKRSIYATAHLLGDLVKKYGSFEKAYIDGYHTHSNDEELKKAQEGWSAIEERRKKLSDSGQCKESLDSPLGSQYCSTGQNGLSVPMSIIYGDTSAMSCGAGTDAGIGEGYARGKKYLMRLCKVQGVLVNANIAENFDRMIVAAKSEGLSLKGGSGFRTMEQQIYLRGVNGCPDIYKSPSSTCSTPTARPGYSNHQMGVAIDFASCKTRGTACYKWLNKNAANFGLYNYPKEAWHWSINGN